MVHRRESLCSEEQSDLRVAQRERMRAPPPDPLLKRANQPLDENLRTSCSFVRGHWLSVITPWDRPQVFQVRNAAFNPLNPFLCLNWYN